MTSISSLVCQLHRELRPLMCAADIPACTQQTLLARLTLFLLLTSRSTPLSLRVRVPEPLEGAELTIYLADTRQITLLVRYLKDASMSTDNLFDAMITLQQRGRKLLQKACYNWEISRVIHKHLSAGS